MATDGQRWRKLDLHTHSPASHDWVGGEFDPGDFVRAALGAGLDGIAVTDHNTAAWIDPVSEAARGSGLIVFPGVEITLPGGQGGIHLLAIFDPGTSAAAVDDLLAAVGIAAAVRGTEEAIADKSVTEAVDLIHKHGGLPVLAHADSGKGVLSDMRGQQRNAVMNNPRLAAVEVSDTHRFRELLNGTDQNFRRPLPVYRSSDNRSTDGSGHDHSGLGAQFTYFKMDEVSLEGLRQCFCDPEVRIRTDEDADPTATAPGPWVRKLTVSAGFLAGTYRFHPGFNCVVGGKGVGKSLLVELLRFALGQPSSLEQIRADHDGKLRDRLGGGAMVVADLSTKSGERIRVSRTYDGDKNAMVVTRSDGTPFEGDLGLVFPVMAYSQTEAVEIARDGTAQLLLVDRLLDLAPLRRRVREIRTELSDLDQAVAACLLEGERASRLGTDLASVTEQLAEVDRLLGSGQHETYMALLPTAEALDSADAALRGLAQLADETRTQFDAALVPEVPEDLRDDALVSAQVEGATEAKRSALDTLDQLIADLHARRSALQGEASDWRASLDQARADYDEWASQAGEGHLQLTERRDRLDADRQQLARDLAEARAKRERLSGLMSSRERLLDDLEVARRDISDARRAKYAEINAATDGRLRLSLAEDGDTRRFAERLMEISRGSYARQEDLRELANSITPRLLGQFLFANDGEGLAHAAGVEAGLADRVVLGAREMSPDEVLSIQHTDLLSDSPTIELQKEDGSYGALSALSVGQKCTALLMIALTDDDAPIIIDQPEDALDLASVFSDITSPIRRRKEERQFLLTTHNPTVAVAGDADRFQVLRASASRTEVSTEGAIERDTVRNEVILHLEGGRRSFALKSRKYGRHVEG